MSVSQSFVAALSDLAVIDATGDDAVSFLQGQLSNDVANLGDDEARLAAYCSPKGRMLASMVLWKQARDGEPGLRMLLKADVAAAVCRRLSMFVLRAKVKLAVTPVQVYGLSLADADTSFESPSNDTDDASGVVTDTRAVTAEAWLARAARHIAAEPWRYRASDAGEWITAPSDGQCRRAWLIVEPDAAVPSGAVPADAWAVQDISAGLPWIEAATQEFFIPQTLNLDLIGGVSFTKGCYPGQEVVARSHYRGTIKRRMARGVATGLPAAVTGLAGRDTFVEHSDNPVGRVVNAASVQDSDGAWQLHALIEVQLADVEQIKPRLGAPDGPEVAIQALPYAIQ